MMQGDPSCFAVWANLITVVEQHEAQLFLFDRTLRSQFQEVNDGT